MTTPRPPEVDLVESTIDPLVYGLALVVLGQENEAHPLVVAARIAIEQLDMHQWRRDMKSASNAVCSAADWNKIGQNHTFRETLRTRRDEPVPFRFRTCIHRNRVDDGPNWDINGPCDDCADLVAPKTPTSAT